jgi:hypothetical protein
MGFEVLKSLASENIVPVEMRDIIFHSANPTELVLAFHADHVIASAVFFFYDYSALGTVHYLR